MNTLKKRSAAEPLATVQPSTWSFRWVWENAVDGMRLTDELGLVQKVNQAYCGLVGKPRGELEGQPFSVIYASDRQASSMRRYRQHFGARTIKPHLRKEAVLWNGRKVWLELSNSFVETESRSPLLFTILRKVSRRQRAEQALRQQHRLLKGLLDEREVEFDLARAIQQGLLPSTVQAPAGFEIGGASCPAHKAGGDYFDFIPMPSGYLGIVVGDASGHGVDAALVMAETRAYLRALALDHTDVRRIVTVTNRRLAEDIGEGHFVTLFLARLNPVTRSLVYSSAGHWPGYILDPQGEVKMVLHSTDGPLGLDPAIAFSTAWAVMLEPGDLIFLHTDGVVEALAPDGALFGKERALRLVRMHREEKPETIIGALFDGVREFCAGVPTDDMTAIVIKVGGVASDSGRE
jgi:sigma-B regulation protein RsbU (phosphoserine phosphatase)